jgi:hypothetical protein
MSTGFAMGERALIPEPGETEAGFSWRVHQALHDELGTDGAQSLAFSLWDEHHGEHPLLGIASGRFGREQFQRTELSPIFSEHTSTAEKRIVDPETGQPEIKRVTTIYDRNALEAVANRCNHRIEDTGDFPPLTEGHTPTQEQLARGAKQPDVLGYSGPFRVGLIGNKDPRWAIFAHEWHDKSARDRLARLRRRSPEVWLEEKMEDRFLDPIAALGAETPRLDMGLTRFNRPGRRVGEFADGRIVAKYSTHVIEPDRYEAAFPGPASVALPSDKIGSRRKYLASGDVPEGTKVDRIYEALKDKGYSKGKAARIAQSQSGQALATGKPPKHDYAAETHNDEGTGPDYGPQEPGKENPDEWAKTVEQRAQHGAPGFAITKPYAAADQSPEGGIESYEAGEQDEPGLDEPGGMDYAAGNDTPAGRFDDGSGGSSMITPEDIQRIVAALEETEEFQWIHSQMPEGPEHAVEPEGGMEPGGMPPGAEPPGAPVGAAPPAIAEPPAEEPAGVGAEGPPAELPGASPDEKKAYAAMPHKMKCEYAAMRRKHYTADGSVMDDAIMRKDREGTVIDDSIMKNSRRQVVQGGSNHELVARCSRLESEVKRLTEANVRETFKAMKAERYSRLQARSREYVFDLADEWERVQDYSKDDFDRHCDGTIIANYQRMPIGIDLPPQDIGEPVGAKSKVQVERLARQRKDKAVEICSRRRLTWAEGYELAGKELGIVSAEDDAA